MAEAQNPESPAATGNSAEARSWVRVGTSQLENDDAALEEAIGALALEHEPRLLIVLAAPRYNLERLSASLGERLRHAQVIGCSTAGEIATGSALTQSLVLWALGGTGVRVSTGYGESGEQGLRQAAVDAADCLAKLERRQHTVMVLLSDGLGGDQMEVVRGAYDAARLDRPGPPTACPGTSLGVTHLPSGTHPWRPSPPKLSAAPCAAATSSRPSVSCTSGRATI